MNTLCFAISNNSDLIIEQDKAYLFMRIFLLDFLNLRLNCTEDTLFSRNKSFVLVMSSWQEVKLSFISGLHELFKHFDFLLRHSKLQIHLSRNFTGRVHATRNINAKDCSCIIVSLSQLQSAFQHIHNIVFDWDLLFFNQKNVWIVAKLTLPKTLVRF